MTDWPSVTLEEICADGGGFIRTGPFGSQLHRSDYIEDPLGIPVVMPKNMSGGSVDMGDIARIDEETAERLSQHLFEAGDIALARRGDVGRSAFIEAADLPALCGTGTMRIHLGSPRSVQPQFLRYVFRSRLASDYLEAHAVGATMPNLNAGIVSAMPVPVPPPAAQERIGATLQGLDDLIENNRRRVEVLEEMARTIYREWFVHFRFPGHEDATFVDSDLGPIPEGWHAPSLDTVARIVRGRSYKKAELLEDGGLPFINLKCMQRGGGFRRDGLKWYAGKYKDTQLVRRGDLVMAVTDLTQGREILTQASLVPPLPAEMGVISLDVVKVEPEDQEERLWTFAALRWSDFADRVKEFANGSTVLHLSPTHVAEAEILWPAHDVRREFAGTLAPMLALVDELTGAAERAAGIRDRLLPKLVTGQIDVSDLDLDAVVEPVVS
jgi:type I restriction enzyme S subunit